MAFRAEMMLQEKNTRFDGHGRRYGVEGSNSSRSITDKNKGHEEKQVVNSEKKDHKAIGKRLVEVRHNQRQNNPYAKPILGKCYRCN